MSRKYYVETWDTDAQKFTPQDGVPIGPYSLFGLRVAVLALRNLGYPCNYDGRHGYSGDPFVSVYREETTEDIAEWNAWDDECNRLNGRREDP
jgi:hypothetical protein